MSSVKVETDEVVVQLNENKENSDFQIIEKRRRASCRKKTRSMSWI